ncbi:unnamed protein product [Prunus armeniaca]
MAWGLANSKQPFSWVIRPGSICGSDWIELLPQEFIEAVGERGCIVKCAPQDGSFWRMTQWAGFGAIAVGTQPWKVYQKGFR